MRALIRWADSWMFEAYAARPMDLAVYRVLFAAYLLFAVVPSGLWVADAPSAFFSPPVSLAALFGGFPPAWAMVALNAALAASACLLLVGWRTPGAAVCTGVLLLCLRSWEYATGKINHDILLVAVPLALAFSGWGRALSVDAARRPARAPHEPRPSWGLGLLAFIIGTAMFAAGALKLLSGWLSPATHATYGHMVLNVVSTGRDTWLSGRLLSTGSATAWEAADWGATLLEVGFAAAMLHQRAFRAALALACLFHLGVWLLFDIVFVANVVAYGAFVAYSPLLERLGLPRGAPGRPLGRRGAAMAIAGTTLVGAAALWAGEPLESALRLQLEEVIIIAGALASAAWLLREARGLLSRMRRTVGTIVRLT